MVSFIFLSIWLILMHLGVYYLLLNAMKGSIQPKIVFNLQGEISKLNASESGYPTKVQIPLSVVPSEFIGKWRPYFDLFGSF